MLTIRTSLFFLLTFVGLAAAHAEDLAATLFEHKAPAVFQVTVIDKASGNKATIGSGFKVSDTGLVATNYHVVADFILQHGSFEIEVIDHDGTSLPALLIDYDIVHDLALLSVAGTSSPAVRVSDIDISQGTSLYSMGNPNDLGMTIVEGTYNGLVEGSRYRKYLFSGSLNPGMSGGPVFNRDGEVIGINVSKGGEQISFLVPATHLLELMRRSAEPVPPEQYFQHARNQLLADQDRYFGALLGKPWTTRSFQHYLLPDRIHDSLKCWGHTMDIDGELYEETHRHCKTTDEIYINADFYTGAFSFNYISISSDRLNASQFYRLLETRNLMSSFDNNASEDDTTGIACVTDFVTIVPEEESDIGKWKVSSCARQYVEYEGLYDAGLIAIDAEASGDGRRALIISIYMQGIDRKNMMNMHRRFMDAVR